MPVIIVHGPAAGPSGCEPIALLRKVNLAASAALGLAPEDVHSMFGPAALAATGEVEDVPWPTALLHGRPRQPELMTATLDEVSRVLAEAFATDPARVWVQWVLTN